MVTLREKFEGCIAGSWAGSAMGAAVEGWPNEMVAEKYGYVTEFKPYRHYHDVTEWHRPPGTTEDGIERQRLMATAIIEKQDRILAHDLVRVWVRDLKPERMIYKQEPFDQSLLDMAAAGVPATELGRLWPYPNVVSLPRGSHPLGLINAGDPQGAADDCFEVGKVYFNETAFAVRWAALYNAGIAAACKPNATVESVLATVYEYANYRAESAKLYARYDTIKHDLDHALNIAKKHTDPMAMRAEFYELYTGGWYFNYGISQANEIVSKGLAIFAFTKGDPKEAITIAVNFGRDTDCLAAIAGGLSGALKGSAALPAEWIEQIDAATAQDPYTNSQRTIAETTEGLYRAYLARRKRLKAQLDTMEVGGYLE